VFITVYNVGTKENLGIDSGMNITISNVYLNGVALHPVSGSSGIAFDKSIGAGAHVTFTAYNSDSFQTGKSYDFKIVTSRSSSFQSQVTY
jgi:hypothetical protein